MNTDKTLTERFCDRNEYPIWYYKELKEIDVDDVILNLLKETFVVELNDKKITMTFGKNRKHEIGCNQSCHEGLDYTSYKTIRKSFREGKWFRITDRDTTEEFKEEYRLNKEKRKAKEIREDRIWMLTRAIDIAESVSREVRDKHIEELKYKSDEELEELSKLLFSSFDK